MKLLSNLLLSCLLVASPAFAESNFEDTYGIATDSSYSALADQVVATRYDDSELTLQQKLNRLRNLQVRIDAKIKQLPNDPMIRFISGLNQNNLAEVQYLTILNKHGQQKASDDIGVSNYNIARSRAYDNAIQLDSNEPHLLSSAIYATMGYGLSNRQKIKTYSRELALGSAAENESNEWFMHWAKIDALVHEKKLDEAQRALTELKTLLESKKKTTTAYSSIVDRAETQVSKQVKTADTRKANASKKSKAKSPDLSDNDQAWGWQTWLIICFGVFTFVFVLVAALTMRRNEKTP